MLLLIAAVLIFSPVLPIGYTLPKLLLLSTVGFLVKGPRATSFDRPLLWFWMILIVSTIFSVDPYYSIVGRYNDWAHGLVGMAVLTTCLLLGASQEKTDLKPLARLAYVLAVWALAERFHTGLRASGPIGDPVALGTLLALLAPIVKLENVYALPLIAGGLWATGSRGAWIGALIGCLL